jgi:hypothetical protein
MDQLLASRRQFRHGRASQLSGSCVQTPSSVATLPAGSSFEDGVLVRESDRVRRCRVTSPFHRTPNRAIPDARAMHRLAMPPTSASATLAGHRSCRQADLRYDDAFDQVGPLVVAAWKCLSAARIALFVPDSLLQMYPLRRAGVKRSFTWQPRNWLSSGTANRTDSQLRLRARSAHFPVHPVPLNKNQSDRDDRRRFARCREQAQFG